MITGGKVNQTPQVSGTIESVSGHIDQKNLVHIMSIMRDMYSDPILAVIREYGANGVDAHNMRPETKDRPIEIVLPTTMKPTISFRDFGPGLSREAFPKLIMGIGASGAHKRESQQQIGGFGIGAKCAHAVCDQFTYTIWHEGKHYVWSCYKDDNDMSKADLLHEGDAPAGETGSLVEVPVKLGDIPRWVERVMTAFTFYRVKPKVSNIPAHHFMKEFRGIKLPLNLVVDGVALEVEIPTNNNTFDMMGTSWLEMGGLAYPIHSKKVGSTEDAFATNHNVIDQMILHAPIGFVQMAPSREFLRYSTFTKNRLAKVYSQLQDSKLTDAAVIGPWMQSRPSDVERVQLYAFLRECLRGTGAYRWNSNNTTITKLDTMMGNLYPHLSFDGVNYRHAWSKKVDNVSIVRLRRMASHYRSTLPNGAALQRMGLYKAVTAKEDTESAGLVDKVGLTEAHISNLYIVRTTKNLNTSHDQLRAYYWSLFNDPKLLATDATVIFVQAADDKAYEAWKEQIPWLTGLGPDRYSDLDPVAPLPKTDTNVFMEHEFISLRAMQTRRKSGRVAMGSQKYAQHSVTVVTWKGDQGGSVKSQNWDAVKMEDIPEDEDKYYLTHEKFVPIWGKITDGQGITSKNLTEFMASLDSKHEVKLYGVRLRDAGDLRKDVTFKPFEEYAVKAVSNMLKEADVSLDRMGWWLGLSNTTTSVQTRTGMESWSTYVTKTSIPWPKFMLQQVKDYEWAMKQEKSPPKWVFALRALKTIHHDSFVKAIQTVYPTISDRTFEPNRTPRYLQRSEVTPENVMTRETEADFSSVLTANRVLLEYSKRQPLLHWFLVMTELHVGYGHKPVIPKVLQDLILKEAEQAQDQLDAEVKAGKR